MMTTTTDPPGLQGRLPFEVQASVARPGAPPPEASIPGISSQAQPAAPLWRLLLGLMVNPEPLLQSRLGRLPWPVMLVVPGFTFTLFFAQTAFDRLRAGTMAWPQALILTGMGLVYGTVGLAFLGLIGWLSLRLLGAHNRPGDVIQRFALAYSPTVVYVVLGLLANLILGWPTAIAFGATGVLWAMGPLMTALRKLSNGRTGLSVTVASVCGAVLLLGWAWLSGGMS